MQSVPTSPKYAASPDPAASPAGQFAYETFFGAAIGGATIALFFLLIDSLGGRPLHTPAVLGTALFTDVDPTAATEVRLEMVYLYSAVHFVAFLLFGAVASALHARLPASQLRPYLTGMLLFALLTGAFWALAEGALPGIGTAIGWQWVLVANVATASAMTVFLERAAEA